MSSRLANEQTGQDLSSVQLDTFFVPGPGQEIVESFGGFGATRNEAIDDAFENFVAGTLHVLLAAFFPDLPTDQADIEEWIVGGTKKRVVVGNFTTRGQLPALREFIPAINRLLENEVKARVLSKGTHWIRLYQARGPTTNINEVLLNNEPDPGLQAAIGLMPWPASTSFYSVRLFLVVQDRSDESRPMDSKDVGPRPWWRFWR
ncbi:MAG TPA: DUF6348 family protein [Planctomycetota bacterium]